MPERNLVKELGLLNDGTCILISSYALNNESELSDFILENHYVSFSNEKAYLEHKHELPANLTPSALKPSMFEDYVCLVTFFIWAPRPRNNIFTGIKIDGNVLKYYVKVSDCLHKYHYAWAPEDCLSIGMSWIKKTVFNSIEHERIILFDIGPDGEGEIVTSELPDSLSKSDIILKLS